MLALIISALKFGCSRLTYLVTTEVFRDNFVKFITTQPKNNLVTWTDVNVGRGWAVKPIARNTELLGRGQLEFYKCTMPTITTHVANLEAATNILPIPFTLNSML